MEAVLYRLSCCGAVLFLFLTEIIDRAAEDEFLGGKIRDISVQAFTGAFGMTHLAENSSVR